MENYLLAERDRRTRHLLDKMNKEQVNKASCYGPVYKSQNQNANNNRMLYTPQSLASKANENRRAKVGTSQKSRF